MLPIQSMFDDLSFRIEVIQTGISVVLCSGSKDAYFEEFGKVIKCHVKIRSDFDADLKGIANLTFDTIRA